MTQTFTSKINDVVRYLFDETSDVENVSIETNLSEEISLLDFYLDSLKLRSEMDKISLNPSDLAVSNILAFSRNYQPVI